MATKTGIGSLKHKLTGLRRNSAKVLKKTNSLVSGAISQLKRADKPKDKTTGAAPARRKTKATAKPIRAAKPSPRPAAAKAAKPEAAPAPKKVRPVATAPVAPVVPEAANDAKPVSNPVPKTIRAAAAAATSPIKTVVAPLQQRVGSVLDFQLPSMPILRRLQPTKPSPDSRASRATSKGKHAALSGAKAAAIQDAGALPADEAHETV